MFEATDYPVNMIEDGYTKLDAIYEWVHNRDGEIEKLKEENEKLKDNFTHGNIHEIAEKNEKLKEGNETLTKGIDLLVYEIEKLKSQIPDNKGKKLSQKDKEALEEILHNIEHPYGTEDHHNDGGGSFYEAKVNLLKRLLK